MGILDFLRPDPAKLTLPSPDDALPGRSQAMPISGRHTVLGTPIAGPPPAGAQEAFFALGCFWGAEKDFWQVPGVITTAVGYQGGLSPNPTYAEVCSGRTGHAETVRVVFDPTKVTYEQLLKVFWESHDPTQGMRQGNDIGTQYRSAIFTTDEAQQRAAEASREMYAASLAAAGYGAITTEVAPAGPFYYAEDYHQQYLDKNPGATARTIRTGVACPIGLGVDAPLG